MRFKSYSVVIFIFVSFLSFSNRSLSGEASSSDKKSFDEIIYSLWNDTAKLQSLLESYLELDICGEREHDIEILIRALIKDIHPDTNPLPRMPEQLSGNDSGRHYFVRANKIITSVDLCYIHRSYSLTDDIFIIKENPRRNYKIVGEIKAAIADLLTRRSLLSIYQRIHTDGDSYEIKVSSRDCEQEQATSFCYPDIEKRIGKTVLHPITETQFDGMDEHDYIDDLNDFFQKSGDISRCFMNCELEIHLPKTINYLLSSDRADAYLIIEKLLTKYLEYKGKGKIKPCPVCSAKSLFKGQDFNRKCWVCDRDLCFKCGNAPHNGIDCAQLQGMSPEEIEAFVIEHATADRETDATLKNEKDDC